MEEFISKYHCCTVSFHYWLTYFFTIAGIGPLFFIYWCWGQIIWQCNWNRSMLKILLSGIPQSQSRHVGLVYMCVCQQFILPNPLILFYMCLVFTLSIYRELCRCMCRYLRFSGPYGPHTKIGIQATKQQMYYLPFSRCPSSTFTACILFFLVSRTCESSQTHGKLITWGSSGLGSKCRS